MILKTPVTGPVLRKHNGTGAHGAHDLGAGLLHLHVAWQLGETRMHQGSYINLGIYVMGTPENGET